MTQRARHGRHGGLGRSERHLEVALERGVERVLGRAAEPVLKGLGERQLDAVVVGHGPFGDHFDVIDGGQAWTIERASKGDPRGTSLRKPAPADG